MEDDSLVGKEVAGFKLEREMGRGGMAVVYAARNALNPKIRRAVKVI